MLNHVQQKGLLVLNHVHPSMKECLNLDQVTYTAAHRLAVYS